jgi:predicted secreted protein
MKQLLDLLKNASHLQTLMSPSQGWPWQMMLQQHFQIMEADYLCQAAEQSSKPMLDLWKTHSINSLELMN